MNWIGYRGIAIALGLSLGACYDDPDSIESADEEGSADWANEASAANDEQPDNDSPSDAIGGSNAASDLFVNNVQPLIASQCGSCHVGKRFAFASLQRTGATFTAADNAANYSTFLSQISLDQPVTSRLLAKMRSTSGGMFHAGGVVAATSDVIYQAALNWIQAEKAARCPDCGTTAPKSYLAYVEAPRIFWALADDPIRNDHGLRDRARIMLRKVNPATGALDPAPAVDFLGNSFCGADGRCDFGHLAPNHAGTKLAFECRLSLEPGKDWVRDVRWNVCIAEIGPDGKAVNPRFLMPPARQHKGETLARIDPFGITVNGGALKGQYDLHFRTRRRSDRGPVFSPDDQRIYFSSKGPDPRTGVDGVQTYHGFEHLDNIVSVRLDGSDARSIYLNEGGVADLPFFLRNGNIAFHTWNLERMDRHMYSQSTADGMQELPVLFGSVQGPSNWGRALQLTNGAIFGITGKRRSAIENYVPFVADHTLGTSNDPDPNLVPFRVLDQTVFQQLADLGFCTSPEGPNCFVSQFYADAAYSPDGRAYITHNPQKTYVLQGEQMYGIYGKGNTTEEKLASILPYTPQKLGISLMDKNGQIQRVLDPPTGMMIYHPAWIGKRAPEIVQPQVTNEAQTTAELHIANVPIWFSFAQSGGTNKSSLFAKLDKMVSLRVMVKALDGTACLNDGRPYRFAVNDGNFDHPTLLGRNNATGFERLTVSQANGGDAFGDVKIRPDGSVKIKVPAGKLLFFQGIDINGHVVWQRDRLLSMPPGQSVNTSVKADQYAAQCMSCHGTANSAVPFKGLTATNQISFVPLDFTTTAAYGQPAADLTVLGAKPVNFLAAIRPLLNSKCVNCHSGANPGGELSLETEYSTTGNYPKGKWATIPGLVEPGYLSFVPVAKRIPAYNYSVSYAWNFKDDEVVYKQNSLYSGLIANHTPLGKLAPWDPAYQNLAAPDNSTSPKSFFYLSGFNNSNFGRSSRLGGISSDSGLIELLSGKDIDPRHNFLNPSVAHKALLTDYEIRTIMSVLDVGYPYMARCADRTIPASGTPSPNAGKPWGDPAFKP